MASRQELVEQVFEAALALKPIEQAAFLDVACGNDLGLRRTVEELLAEDARAGSFLEHSPLEFLDQAVMSPPRVAGTTDSISGNLVPSPPAAMGRFKPGQVLIDRFVIVRFIAKGGMGEVYEVEDRFLQGVHIALKTILPHIADDPALQQRFEREVLVAREVTHPNLCPIYDIFRCEQPLPNFLFLTMKFLPGETLAARLRGTTPIPIEEGLAILKQMAAGLAAIHSASIVHRDIKPNNIMLDGSGSDVRLCITDFGLARAYESEASFSGKGIVVGTPGYMAPELYLRKPPSQASDLFAFGVVLHEVFTGQKPAAPDGSSAVVSPRLNTSGVPSFCSQLIVGCLDRDPQRRCQAFEHALDLLKLKYRRRELWTRRQFAATAVAAVCTLAGGVWWKKDELEDLLHPLPSKRFIALLDWPKTSDIHVTPMLTSVLTAIKGEIARAEPFDKDLFVISPEDVGLNVAGVTQLKEVCDPLGTNLVLAAAGVPGATHFQLFLRLLDPVSGQQLREKKVTCALAEITSLPGKAVEAAASLLDLNPYRRNDEWAKPGTRSVPAFTAFQSAETLMKQPNDTGLEAAIEKYKQAVELDSRYAIAYARLALAYIRFYAIRQGPEALNLAQGNCQVALTLDPDLPDGHLALASVFKQTGNEEAALNEVAKALSLDPSNARTLVWQAQIYTRLNRWEDAEKTFHRVLKDHPNYWFAYNELGFGLDGQGKYQEAIQAFLAASLAAPRSSIALSNLGVEYLQIGDFTAATETLKRSLIVDPQSYETAANTSLALRYQGKYDEALPFARKAVELNPAKDTNWLELADCYSSLHIYPTEAKNAYQRAAKEAERHLQTDATNGPAWMLLALYKVKSGNPQVAPALIERAELVGALDVNSQLYKARILELLGKREEALATLAACFQKGATDLQMVPYPDMQLLRKAPRYRQLLQSKSLKT